MTHSVQAKALDDLISSGPLTVMVNGECMDDSVPSGCAMKINRRPLYWPGDILVFRRGDQQMVSHRMLGYVPGRRGWKIVTKADNESLPDAPHLVSRVLGKSIAIDGKPYRTGHWTRIRAAASLPLAIIHLLIQRFNGKHSNI